MKKILTPAFWILLLWPFMILAEEEIAAPTETTIEPIISAEDQVLLGQSLVLDASDSAVGNTSEKGNPNYIWIISKDGESETKFTKTITYPFSEKGIYEVKLSIKQGGEKKSVKKSVLVYDKKAVFVTDNQESFKSVNVLAAKSGVWLQKIQLEASDTNFSTESEFISQYQQNIELIRTADLLIFGSASDLPLWSFSQFWTKLGTESKIDLTDKTILRISDKDLSKLLKTTQPVYETLGVPIILAKESVLELLFEKIDRESFVSELSAQGYAYKLVNADSKPASWLPLKNIISYFSQNGVSLSIIYLLLSVPFLAFIVAFARQFIGISTFGVFAPLMLSLSFLVMGLQFGLSVFVVVLIVSYVIRIFFEKVELLYIPRVALLMSFLALSFFLILALAVYMGTSLNLALTIFPMMVMSTISEKFIASQSSAGFKSSLISVTETIIVALLAYVFVDLEWMRTMVLGTPELILLPMLGNVALGKFTGLRVAEYLKFRSLLGDDTQE